MRPRETLCVEAAGSWQDAALVNVVTTNATSSGYGVLASPSVLNDTEAIRAVSNFNFQPGGVHTNLAVAPLDLLIVLKPLLVCFFNSPHTSVDVIADHLGTVRAAAFVRASASGLPTRVVDTRVDVSGSRIEPGGRACFPAGEPGNAALVNLTVVGASAGGYGQLVSSDVAAPELFSNLNFAPGRIDPSLALAPIGSDGQVCFVNSPHASVDLIADHIGSIRSSAFAVPAGGTALRLADTRVGQGGDRIAEGGRLCMATGSPGDVAVVNLTPVLASGTGYGQLLSSDVVEQAAFSNVNFTADTVDANLAVAPIGSDGRVCFVNSGHSSVDLVADLLGTIAGDAFVLPSENGVPVRLADTRPVGSIVLESADSIQKLDCSDDGLLCLAAGQSADGRLAAYFSHDAGTTWSAPLDVDETAPIRDVVCPTSSTCWIVGGDTSSPTGPFGAFAYRTADAGASITRIALPADTGALTAISCPSEDLCVAADPSRAVLHTDGTTWDRFATTVWMEDIECQTVERCIGTGTGFDTAFGGRAAALSTDLGRTWTDEISLPFLARNMQCFDALRCLFSVVGDNPGGGTPPFSDLYETVDGGSTWSVSELPFFAGGGSGGLSCATPDWCIVHGPQPNHVYQSSGEEGRAWTLTGVAVPAEADFVRCPMQDACFVFGGEPGSGYVTRVSFG